MSKIGTTSVKAQFYTDSTIRVVKWLAEGMPEKRTHNDVSGLSVFNALLKSLTIVSTEAPISAFAESTGAKWRNLLKNRFLDSPAARSK